MWSVKCGVWSEEYGMMCVESRVWWSVECGVWNVECGE